MSVQTSSSPALYLDTSALLLLYLERDPLSAYVFEQFQAASALVVSGLSLAEGKSALAQRKARKVMTGAHYTRARTRFLEDWPTLSRVPVSEALLEQAGNLCEKYPTLRALDGIHLATVLELSKAGEMRFLTFDVRQRDVARLELGSRVLDSDARARLEGDSQNG